MFLALLLAATLDSDVVCKKYEHFTLPAEAQKAYDECKCDLDLAEEFANGDEVGRDYDVAEYFLCRASIAPAEFDGMWEHLQRMRNDETDEPLRFCDHVTSGYGQGRCASETYADVMPRYEETVNALRETTNVKKQFTALEDAAKAYIERETERIGEQSLGGTAHAALTIEAEIAATKSYVESLSLYTNERAPAATAADLKTADDLLNKNFVAERATYIEEEYSHSDWKALYRDTQRAWIRYRDAFAEYYVARWKRTAADDVLRREILTVLTRQRAKDFAE